MENQAKPSTIAVPTLLDMLKAGVHFGHLTSKWHPKMQPYIFTARQGVHIINLEVTRQQLERALRFVSDTVAAGGQVIYVGTKKQVQDVVKERAVAVNMPYVHERWIGGLLTNFAVIKKMISRHAELGRPLSVEEEARLTKKEKLERQREFRRLEGVIGGIAMLERLPAALFMIDLRREKTALREARLAGVPVVGLCDTNVNPELVQYPIASNDDAVGALEMMVDLVTEAVREGLSRRQVAPPPLAAPDVAADAAVAAPAAAVVGEVAEAEGGEEA